MNFSDKQYKRLKKLFDNPENVLVVHWARQNLKDNSGGFTPRITAIFVQSLDESTNRYFAIHLEAEKIGLIPEDIETYYDQLEEQILKDFNEFVREYNNCEWVYWDSDDPHSGFEATNHRYQVLVNKEDQNLVEIPVHKRVNLNSCLKEIYGVNYESIPQLDNLMKSNNDGQLKSDVLSIQDEARAFKNADFSGILQSIKSKADFLIEVIRKAVDKNLSVRNKNLIYRIGKFFSHPIMIGIAWLCTVISLIVAFF
ncbi:hypothetical protein AB9P05_22260 [Roseivirga sp. BDSF3-8]|uniref:hypothetical protein n=1 Tax=Roseivirga sp. BDSF3-8 TaxID=3241598 RepID=UPI0035320BEC